MMVAREMQATGDSAKLDDDNLLLIVDFLLLSPFKDKTFISFLYVHVYSCSSYMHGITIIV